MSQIEAIRTAIIDRRERDGKPPLTEYRLGKKVERALRTLHTPTGRAILDRIDARADRNRAHREARIIREEGQLREGPERTTSDPAGELAVFGSPLARATRAPRLTS